jgi:hypothetical protein
MDGCCGASASERKRQELCACWTNQSLHSRLSQHGHVSEASTSFKTSLLHIFHWITSARGMDAHARWLYLHVGVSALPAEHRAAAKSTTFTSPRRQYQGSQYGHNTQTRQGLVALTILLFFTASRPLHVSSRPIFQQLTALFIVFTISLCSLCKGLPDNALHPDIL